MGVCVWLGAQKIHWMSGLNLVGHWQGCWGHVHFRSHLETIESWGWLFRLLAFVNVQNLGFWLACSVCVISRVTLLCLAILSFLDTDVHRLIIGVATCLCCYCDEVCS